MSRIDVDPQALIGAGNSLAGALQTANSCGPRLATAAAEIAVYRFDLESRLLSAAAFIGELEFKMSQAQQVMYFAASRYIAAEAQARGMSPNDAARLGQTVLAGALTTGAELDAGAVALGLIAGADDVVIGSAKEDVANAVTELTGSEQLGGDFGQLFSDGVGVFIPGIGGVIVGSPDYVQHLSDASEDFQNGDYIDCFLDDGPRAIPVVGDAWALGEDIGFTAIDIGERVAEPVTYVTNQAVGLVEHGVREVESGASAFATTVTNQIGAAARDLGF